MAIPKDRTSYMCAVFEIPKFNETHHMIKVGIPHFNHLKKQNILNRMPTIGWLSNCKSAGR